jgi:site-specific recombinase XerD
MDKPLFLGTWNRRRMAANDVGIILFSYADELHARGYSRDTIQQYTQVVEHFGFWRNRSHPASQEIQSGEIEEFLSSHLTSCSCPKPANRTYRTCRAALYRFMAMLGVKKTTSRFRDSDAIGKLVVSYDQHVAAVCGLSDVTRLYRRRYAREFLEWRFKRKPIDLRKLCFTDFLGYVKLRAPLLKPASTAVMITSLRGFVRFLEFEQKCPLGLCHAWPTVACWKKSPPSDIPTSTQCRDLLRAVDLSSKAGRRDLAILRLILDLGLRCSQVTNLCLEDIDWRAGTLMVRASKQRRERLLPLPEPVGIAVSDYLRTARPETSNRRLFLCHRPPVGQPITRQRVRGAIRRAMGRCGLTHGGTHHLRHFFATKLHVRGASLKELADILGHQQLNTTAIYARVNLEQLRKVAMPWPGSIR